MREPKHPEPVGAQSGLEWRHRRALAIARRGRWLSDRDAFLESSLEPGERVIARHASHPLVTDRRILTAGQLRGPSRERTWILDPVAFDQIVAWSQGEHHDGRPILRLTHQPLTRIRWVPARRFLWWTWGNALGSVVETTTTLAFGRRTNLVFRAIGTELARRSVREGPSFVLRPAGNRAERVRESRAPLRAYHRVGRISHLWDRTRFVYPGELAWPLRALSWTLAAAVAWLASPWLVLPAILASEVAWIVVMRWPSLRRHRVGPIDVDPDQPAP